MPFFLFTFRPQITEQELFEQFLSIFLPLLEDFSKFSYSIEEDGTLNKHIHVMVESKAKDNCAWKQFFNKSPFKDFKQAIKTKQTNPDVGFDDRMVKRKEGKTIIEDKLKVLGYVNKETNCPRRKYKGFTNEEILEAVEFYYTTKHLEKSKIKNDLTLVTPKNIHILTKTFCEQNKIEPTDSLLKLKMNAQGYCFSQCPKVDETFQELEAVMFPERYEKGIFGDDEGMMESYKDLQDKIQFLTEYIESLRKVVPTTRVYIPEKGNRLGYYQYS